MQHLFNGSGETILKCGDLSIEATILTPEEAGLLQAPQPLAAFCLEHLFYDFDDKPMSGAGSSAAPIAYASRPGSGRRWIERMRMKTTKARDQLIGLLADLDEEAVLQLVRSVSRPGMIRCKSSKTQTRACARWGCATNRASSSFRD